MITPAVHGRSGNSITAQRWALRLRELGHCVHVATAYAGQQCDLLVALHARKSAASVAAFRRRCPDRPVIVALTGTDVYRDLRRSAVARRTLAAADRIVVLQPLAAHAVSARLRSRIVVIYQSAVTPSHPTAPRKRRGLAEVLVLAHLRAVKDPLRAAYAVRLLPPVARLRVVHAGRAHSATWAARARREMVRNSRYRWLGELSHPAAKRRLMRAALLVVASRLEGGANVVSEAIVAGTPVVASRIPGNVGLLGARYPGYFPVGDTVGLAALLQRVDTDARFVASLRRAARLLAPRFRPDRERAAWKSLLSELLDRKPK